MFIELGLMFLAAAALAFGLGLWRQRTAWRQILPAVATSMFVMLGLTAIFDNVMIAAGLFDYGEHALLGIRVGRAPVEDFLYPVCAVLLMPGLWWLLGGPAASGKGARPSPTAEEKSC